VIEQDDARRTYRGIGPHAADPRAARAAVRLIERIRSVLPDADIEHVGSTAVPDLPGKNVVDLQITAEPDDVAWIAEALLEIGFARQRGPDPWPPERPMLEGTIEQEGAVFGIHCHVVPSTDPDVDQMIALRDLLRVEPAAREAYAADKLRIVAETDDVLEYTQRKTALIRRLLEERRSSSGS
jgi:dephospho-CoA kinase